MSSARARLGPQPRAAALALACLALTACDQLARGLGRFLTFALASFGGAVGLAALVSMVVGLTRKTPSGAEVGIACYFAASGAFFAWIFAQLAPDLARLEPWALGLPFLFAPTWVWPAVAAYRYLGFARPERFPVWAKVALVLAPLAHTGALAAMTFL